jgi:hypothetical protein
MFEEALCFVLANDRKKETVYAVLNKYISEYEKIPGDYGFGCEKDFANEDEILTYLETNKNKSGSFHWNKHRNNPDNIMVGAYFTIDGYLIMSLTLDGDEKKEVVYLEDLKRTLNSDVGVIYYNCFPQFENGEDFQKKYGSMKRNLGDVLRSLLKNLISR